MPYLFALPEWALYLLIGVSLFIGISSIAVVLTRMGRSPYWAFLVLVPVVPIVAAWYLAFSVWPKPLKKAG